MIARLLRSVFARPRAWWLAIAILSAPFAVFLPRLQIRTDGAVLYPAHNAVVDSSAADRARFRDPEAVVVLVTARDTTAGVFTPAGLRYVAALTERLRAQPGLRHDAAISLATLLDVSTSTQTIRLTRYLDTPPATPEAARALRTRLDADGIYAGLLYGTDGRSTAIYLPIDATGAARVAVVHRLREAVRAAADPAFDVRLTGPVVAEVLLGENILTDLTRLLPLVILVVLAALCLCLRSIAGAAIPMLEIGFVMVWTFGAMALAGVPLTLVTSVLPVLLMAMAITDQIHVIERLQTHLGQGLDRRAALDRTYAEIGLPIVRTALTTALGFLAFTTASVPAMRHFGLFACLGLLLSMAFSFTLIPATLALVPDAWLRHTPPRADATPRGFEGWAARHPRAAALIAAAGFVAALGGFARLHVQDSWVLNFSPHSDLAVAERQFNRAYWGSYRLDVTLASREPGFFRTARGLAIVDSLQRRVARERGVGGTQSPVDLARVALRGIDPTRRVAALDDAGLAQLLMLLDMSGGQDQLDRLLTPDGRAARIRCYVRSADYALATRLLARVEMLTRDLPRAAGVDARLTGDLAVATQVVAATVSNQVRSIAAAALGLLVLLAVSFRSLTIAWILLAPVLATSLIVFGGMGYAGVALGVATSMFAALAEGEGVNYTIHIVSRFLELRRDHEPADALRETLESVGPAVRWNGVALISGCLMLCLSALRPVRALGALLALGMTLSYALAFMVLPVLLLRRGRRGAPVRAGATVATVAFAIALLAAASPASAAAPAHRDDPAARRLMIAVERNQRAGDRFIAMDVDLTVAGRFTTHRRMLALAHADAKTTDLLYVYAWPREFRGSTLVVEDAVASSTPDHIWLWLPGLDTFREVQAAGLSMLVPGTGLTYEDARGWIAPEKYDFGFGAASDSAGRAGGPGTLTIIAHPKTDSLARALGNARLEIQIDPARAVVTRVQFFDAAGQLIKRFEALEFTRLDGRWLPARVHTMHQAQRLDATIAYHYRALSAPPPIALFRFQGAASPFLERLLAWRDVHGFTTEFADSFAAATPAAR